MSIKEFAKEKNESIRAVIHEAEEGGYWATIPAFPGCVTEGETIEETKSNLLEAAEVWLLHEVAGGIACPLPELDEVRDGVRMKPLTARQVEQILADNGFERGHGKGSHFGWYNPLTKRQTVVPHHGNRALKQGTLQEIFRQAGIPKPR